MNRILIVEDEKPISELIRLCLTDLGYNCTCVDNGNKVVELIDEGVWDLILLDIMLPEIDGYQLMEYIRPFEIPVIFLTAKSDVRDKVKGLRLGAEDYLTKPFETLIG